MLGSDELEMPGESRLGRKRKQAHAVLVALAAPHENLVGSEVDILDPESSAFQEPKAGTIHQGGHQLGRPVEMFQNGPNLVTGQDDGD